jgi:hypothetical protein
MHKAQRLINHVALVLDGSTSMRPHQRNLIKVADEQIQHLALRSEELQQETRVSVYVFDSLVRCVIFDMDVMRLPSIADLYTVQGMTALVDAVAQSQEDLSTTSQIYGDHAFLTFVLTDGQENKSRRPWTVLKNYTSQADENWTVGFLVPDSSGEAYLTRAGVDRGSISLWDKDSAKGLNDSFTTIRTATDNFMTARASGVRGTRSVFSTGVDAVNKSTVKGTLKALDKNSYSLVPVKSKVQIRDFVQSLGLQYFQGKGYYQLTKTETIQASKQIVVVDKTSGVAYGGAQARQMIGLPDRATRVKPDYNPQYDIYVQSTSVNRNLMPGTKLLLIK